MNYPLTLDYNRINKLQSLFGFAGVYNRFIRAIMNVSTSKAERAFLFVMEKICIVDGCENKQLARGFCSKHYNRYLRHGDPYIVYPKIGPPKKHGMCGTIEYNTWCNMIQRCCGKKHSSYHRYGGRGIIVCESWKNSFETFLKDMGSKPFLKAQIDRINNDGNYEPSNCRWVTSKENANNRSNSIRKNNNVTE